MAEIHIGKGGTYLKVPCGVILDLIPLVKDQVASCDSRDLVLNHIESCNQCKDEFENYEGLAPDKLDDEKILASIKKSLFFMGLTLLFLGALVGIALSNSFGMFYNFILMPLVGGLGYVVFKKQWYLVPLGVLAMSYLWLFITFVIEGGLAPWAFYSPVYLSSIYAFLVFIGAVIAQLLEFAFRKEV